MTGSVHQQPATTLKKDPLDEFYLIVENLHLKCKMGLINKATSPHVLLDIIKYHFDHLSEVVKLLSQTITTSILVLYSF